VSSTLLEASWDRLDDLLGALPVRQRVTVFGQDPRLEVPDDRLISSDLTDPPAIVFSAGVWAVGELRQQPARTTSNLVAAMQRERDRLSGPPDGAVPLGDGRWELTFGNPEDWISGDTYDVDVVRAAYDTLVPLLTPSTSI
jgi:hypothetical protein